MVYCLRLRRLETSLLYGPACYKHALYSFSLRFGSISNEELDIRFWLLMKFQHLLLQLLRTYSCGEVNAVTENQTLYLEYTYQASQEAK
jgi:hypothetical protein